MIVALHPYYLRIGPISIERARQQVLVQREDSRLDGEFLYDLNLACAHAEEWWASVPLRVVVVIYPFNRSTLRCLFVKEAIPHILWAIGLATLLSEVSFILKFVGWLNVVGHKKFQDQNSEGKDVLGYRLVLVPLWVLIIVLDVIVIKVVVRLRLEVRSI